MNRRTALGALGTAIFVPVVGYSSARDGSTVSVRFWLTPGAARYTGLEGCVRRLLRRGLAFDHWTVEVTAGGVVDIGTESAAETMRSGRWPGAVGAGIAGVRDVDPVWDVNLLVTDGSLADSPSGYGVPHVAAVGGASALTTVELDGSFDEPVPITDATFASQLVLHEVGHAFGLSHEDGSRYERSGSSVVTPMLSLYGWRREQLPESTCGGPVTSGPPAEGKDRQLDLTFSDCARRSLRTYDGNHLG
ncbi:hypothetical protein Halru_1527 [Halovivax ruber XH-70]|uniref:Matrixin n=1 Tax=Halovivax ruber (strain DSM 18193 / JCM 13892 / XH-70) TaxID=797302 RepID=L0I949_HALRX|nr:hypothetical protein [Halovivax ruber]AGB16135.1 hypothetical protein Halru_1527 [Halovivax ruber XH-70]